MIRLVKETDAEAIMNIRKEIILSETTTKFFIVSPKKLPNDMNAERRKRYGKVMRKVIFISCMK